MRIVIATDSFKGSNSSLAAGNCMARGAAKVFPDADITVIPIGDGGEGTVDAVIQQLGGTMKHLTVTGPLGDQVEASYGTADATAVIEMASASGLTLVPEDRRNPLATTTYGTGELIADAIAHGCIRILVAIGGSATNDGGAGMAQALGWSFRDAEDKEIGFGGRALGGVRTIDASRVNPRLSSVSLEILSDVTNPLCGPNGASRVYGPQKGADDRMVELLDEHLFHLDYLVKEQLGLDLSGVPGSGAAGGLGFGLMAFAGGTLVPGIEAVLDVIGFSEQVKGADLVITGEGKMDGQSVQGKAPIGVAKAAKQFGIPVLAVVGDIGKDIQAVYDHGIDSVMSIVNRPMPLSTAMAESGDLLTDAVERALRMVRMGMR